MGGAGGGEGFESDSLISGWGKEEAGGPEIAGSAR